MIFNAGVLAIKDFIIWSIVCLSVCRRYFQWKIYRMDTLKTINNEKKIFVPNVFNSKKNKNGGN